MSIQQVPVPFAHQGNTRSGASVQQTVSRPNHTPKTSAAIASSLNVLPALHFGAAERPKETPAISLGKVYYFLNKASEIAHEKNKQNNPGVIDIPEFLYAITTEALDGLDAQKETPALFFLMPYTRQNGKDKHIALKDESNLNLTKITLLKLQNKLYEQIFPKPQGFFASIGQAIRDFFNGIIKGIKSLFGENNYPIRLSEKLEETLSGFKAPGEKESTNNSVARALRFHIDDQLSNKDTKSQWNQYFKSVDNAFAKLTTNEILGEKSQEPITLKEQLAQLEEQLATEGLNNNQLVRLAQLAQTKILLRTAGIDLGEDDLSNREVRGFVEKFTKVGPKMQNEQQRQQVVEALNKIKGLTPMSAEYESVRSWLDFTLNKIQWEEKRPPEGQTLEKLKATLDELYYGKDELKRDILASFLAQERRRQNGIDARYGKIICLVGEPGTGKTYIGEALAKAMNTGFAKLSMANIKDPDELTGHRRTYIGALPGQILQGVAESGCLNPVFLINEVDKIGMNQKGNPTDSLLEALDPEQNKGFKENYFNAPFDLSNVTFILTANSWENIPQALQDRAIKIQVPNYTKHEKKNIAWEHSIPKLIQVAGFKLPDNRQEQIKIAKTLFPEAALDQIINAVSRKDSGLRSLERALDAILSEWAITQNPTKPELDKAIDIETPEMKAKIKFIASGGDNKGQLGFKLPHELD